MKKPGPRPYVVMVSEVTVDGKLTLRRGVSSKIIMSRMDEEAERYLHRERAASDAIMVGCNTIKIDDSILTVRSVEGENPIRVIPCSRGDLPLNSNVLRRDAPTIIAVSSLAPDENIERIRGLGAEVWVCGSDRVDLVLLLSMLYEKGVRRLMLEGGPTLAWEMIKNQLIDEIKLIHMPFVVGGRDTPSLIGGEGVGRIDNVIDVELERYFLCGKHLITEYRLKYPKI
ncbi:MAG TPA: 5-amino-6-(5-phosphoribosylamino)uracil reductase [Candidatus Syntrophoarchaeum butanivorans]|uniref:5-amino-6-(5-phosphoribosylamino)uracil reductase n=1 Tax=Candidatus Syntropharchaeum butanivorans TaxID=1839936 RepID=A0A7J2S1X0_9EURY|nr:MAG: 5-amino-6-(5-phosphoribosylamino)uracil reductase [Candidatus Syntrophoarchaeum sp. WYZ-LMO15]HEC57456.1 5-amino-6-(5-phosphoribosylamino)uracil reductase [Candidatus Syntrophoarchaeum butanivorans]